MILITRIATLIVLLTTCVNFISIAQDKPSLFEPSLISDNGVFGFTLSPKADEAFWVKSNGGRDILIIMHSQKVGTTWQTPKPASFSNSQESWKDIDPVFSPDGNMILFQSNRPVASMPNRKGLDMWAVDRVKGGWGEAYHLGNEINSDESEAFASITNDKSIYFMKQNPNGLGKSDIYTSKFVNGKYQTPLNVGAPINTTNTQSNPFISPNEDYIIYYSDDSLGFGDVDLYISFRKNNQWTTPINLGEPINTKVGEFCPFIHERQKKIYFSRTEDKLNGRRIENIYYYPFDLRKYKK